MRRVPLIAPSILLSLAALASAACADDSASASDVVRSDAERATASAEAGQATAGSVEEFGADLYALLAQREGNLVFSPYSVAVALAMTRAGAEGETAAQMDAVLHADQASDLHGGFNAIEQALATRPGEYPMGDGRVTLELATANQLWGQRGYEFDAAFLDTLAAKYGAGLRLVDYVEATEEARTTINEWVSEQTRERIPELIPQGVIDTMTRLVLTNAIYLNAPWQHPFSEGATSPAPFHLIDGGEVQAQLMSLSGSLAYASGDGYEAVELPYVGGSLAMLVVVPNGGAFAGVEARLDGAFLREVTEALAGQPVNLRFPRFEFRTQAQLKPALGNLGMPSAFTDQADFSAMSTEGDLLIQDVVHEAFISVDEEGTEAAAATAVVVGATGAPMDPVELTVDRPFLFAIRDTETGALLFLGRVVDPTE